MISDLQVAALKIVNAIVGAGVPKGDPIRDATDVLTNTHPNREALARYLLNTYHKCSNEALNFERSYIEREVFDGLASECHQQIIGLLK